VGVGQGWGVDGAIKIHISEIKKEMTFHRGKTPGKKGRFCHPIRIGKGGRGAWFRGYHYGESGGEPRGAIGGLIYSLGVNLLTESQDRRRKPVRDHRSLGALLQEGKVVKGSLSQTEGRRG